MDAVALSHKMRRLAVWLDEHSERAGTIHRPPSGSPFGQCHITIDPDRQGRFASGNFNRVLLCGSEEGLGPEGLEQLIQLFSQAGVGKFFVWLSPGPGMDEMRRTLRKAGLSRFEGTGYP